MKLSLVYLHINSAESDAMSFRVKTRMLLKRTILILEPADTREVVPSLSSSAKSFELLSGESFIHSVSFQQ